MAFSKPSKDLAPPPAHTVIFGGKQQGMAIANAFGKQFSDFLIVSADPEDAAELQKQGFNATTIKHVDDTELTGIGIGQWVHTIFCMYSDDAQNVFITLSARVLAPGLRIFCIASSQDSANKLLAAGATKIIDPYEITANHIGHLIRRPLLVEALEHTILGHANLDLSEIRILPHSVLHGKHLNEIPLEKYNLILLGVVDQELSDRLIFNTARLNHKLDAGDYLVLIGPGEEITRFRQDMALCEKS